MFPLKSAFKALSLFLLLLITINTVNAQVYDIHETIDVDSLKAVLEFSLEEQYPALLLDIAKGYFIIEPDSCMKYAQIGYELAQENGNQELQAKADLILGKAYYFKSEYDLSAEFLLKAFDYYRSVNDTANVYNLLVLDLGMTYWYSGNHDALRHHMIMIEEEYMDWFRGTPRMIYLVPIVGFGYAQIKEYHRSIKLYDQFFELCEQVPVPPKMRAHFLKYQGVNYSSLGEYLKAIEYLKRSNELRQQTGQRMLFHNIANAYYKLDSLDRAMEYFKKHLELYEEGNEYSSVAGAYFNIGKIQLKKRAIQEAERYLLKALQLYTWIFDNKRTAETKEEDMTMFFMAQQSVDSYAEATGLEGIAAVHFELYQLYESFSPTKALDHFVKYHNALLTLKDNEQIVAIEEVQEKYDAEKKEQKISMLSQQNELADLKLRQTRLIGFALGGLLILVVGLALLFIRMIRIRAIQKSTILEQKLLRSQMNPHFIFNSLSNISNLVDKKETEKASNYLNRFARLVRHILESTREEYILLEEELSNLENYMKIQQLRLNDKFEYSLEVDHGINPEEIMILPMIIQPFVENAIEHGIKSKETKGLVTVRLKRKNDTIYCEIEDNGIGREQSMNVKAHNGKHRSYGVNIVKERLAAMSRKVRQKVKLKTTDLKSDTGQPNGTLVVINMPLKAAF